MSDFESINEERKKNEKKQKQVKKENKEKPKALKAEEKRQRQYFKNNILPIAEKIGKRFAYAAWGRNSIFKKKWQEGFWEEGGRCAYEIWQPVSPKPFKERLSVISFDGLIKVSLWQYKPMGFKEYYAVFDTSFSEGEFRNILENMYIDKAPKTSIKEAFHDYFTTLSLFETDRHLSSEAELFRVQSGPIIGVNAGVK